MRLVLFVVLTFFIFSCKTEEPVEFPTMKVTYPETRKDSIVDNYHGQDISDPYRWLEDDMSDETAEWVKSQNDVTYDYLSKIPFKKDLENRLAELWDYEKYSSPFKEGNQYYYFKNDGLQNQSVLYATEDPKQDGKVVLDPNKFSDDGTSSLGGFDISENGKYLAYLISEGGSDWRKAKVLDLESGELL